MNGNDKPASVHTQLQKDHNSHRHKEIDNTLTHTHILIQLQKQSTQNTTCTHTSTHRKTTNLKWGGRLTVHKLLTSSHMSVCVSMLLGVRVCIRTALKSSCSVSHDRPSVCRCSSRSGGVPGEASKSSQGSGGGEPRLSESFSMFIHPTLLLLLVQQPTPPASFRIQMQSMLTNPYPLTTHLSPCISHCIAASVSFSQHLCNFLSTSPHLTPLLVVSSLFSLSLNFASVSLPVHLHFFSQNCCSHSLSSFLSFSTSRAAYPVH